MKELSLFVDAVALSVFKKIGRVFWIVPFFLCADLRYSIEHNVILCSGLGSVHEEVCAIEFQAMSSEHADPLGSVFLMRLPDLLGAYAVMDLYVEPVYRKYGIGRSLLQSVIQYRENMKVGMTIYIQPGPFERKGGQVSFGVQGIDNYEIKRQRLSAFYKNLGFRPVSLMKRVIARCVYWICGIQEDASYLLEMYV